MLPRLAHRLAMVISQVSIGDPVVMEPGVYIVHGQVVVDGLVEIGREPVISPFVTIGLRAGDVQGPTIERGVNIGTGAKVIGAVRVGAGATIGAGRRRRRRCPGGGHRGRCARARGGLHSRLKRVVA